MKKSFFLLVIILFNAFILRITFLTEYPEGFYQNEASWGYNAYSLLETGKDEYGKFMPIVLESFGDYKMALHAYILIPFILMLGLNEFTIRFSTVLISLLSLILSYLIVRKLTKNNKVALLSLFILSILPWHIVFSRIGNETMTALCLFLSSGFVFLEWLENKKLLLLVCSVILQILSVLTYYSVWIPTIFSVGMYFFYVLKEKKIDFNFIPLMFIVFLPLVVIIFSYKSSGSERLKQINIFQNIGAQPLLEEQIREDQKNFPYYFTRIFHNKLSFYPFFIIKNYFNTLNINFLFFDGDYSEQVYKVPFNGVLYSVFLPVLIIGIIILITEVKIHLKILIISFIIIGFMGNAISVFGSESQRTLISSLAFSILITYGIIKFHKLSIYNKYIKAIFFLFFIIFLYQIADFNHQYFWHSNHNKPWYRNFGEKEMIQTIADLGQRYEKIVITGNTSSYIYYYFYNRIDPKIAQKEALEMLNNKDKDALLHRYRNRFGNNLIMPLDCPSAGKIGVLYVCRGNRIPKNSKIIKTIYFKDFQPAYIFIEFTANLQNEILKDPIKYTDHYELIKSNSNKLWMSEEELLNKN
jgi:hypothetical protein